MIRRCHRTLPTHTAYAHITAQRRTWPSSPSLARPGRKPPPIAAGLTSVNDSARLRMRALMKASSQTKNVGATRAPTCLFSR
jgi:hypothetical protein